MVRADGETRWVTTRGKVERDVNGRSLKVHGVSVNATERKNAENEANRLRLELAHLNRVMTMSELSTSLAHKINRPLGAILNNASPAKIMHERCGGTGGGEVENILDDIINDAKRAGLVLRKVRGMVRKEAVFFERLDVNTLLRDAVSKEKISVRDELPFHSRSRPTEVASRERSRCAHLYCRGRPVIANDDRGEA